ncbi:MAG TPA: hypothetical protein VFQ38_23735 [Longimicrobiales bacterium]|nr:hypothetical protein [Longimicrobiales bacterium]
MTRFPAPLLPLALALVACGRPLPAQQTGGAMGEGDADATAAAHAAMAHEHVHADPHLLMSSPRPATRRDSARAAALLADMRRELARYRDVRVAEREGYRPFLPNLPQPVYHYTSASRAIGEAFRFDVAKPTSLLYRKEADGGFTLVGAMYTAPRRVSEAELDERIPLGIARWHQHVNWCMPPRTQRERWREVKDGRPVFGPLSPIATREACDAVGGVFHEHLFGWMVHVNAWEEQPFEAHGH